MLERRCRRILRGSRLPKRRVDSSGPQNDTLKVDGSFAIAWSASLNFTVERTTKSLIGSAASGEGLVNVYRGTGRVLMMPVAAGSAFCGTGAHQIAIGD